MTSRNLMIPLAVLLVVFLVLSNIFNSSDPGARGIIADISFFGFLLLALYFIVAGALMLMRRMRRTV